MTPEVQTAEIKPTKAEWVWAVIMIVVVVVNSLIIYVPRYDCPNLPHIIITVTTEGR